MASCYEGVYQVADTVAEMIYGIGQILCFEHSKKFPDIVFLGLTTGLASLQIKAGINDGEITFTGRGKFRGLNDKIKKNIR